MKHKLSTEPWYDRIRTWYMRNVVCFLLGHVTLDDDLCYRCESSWPRRRH